MDGDQLIVASQGRETSATQGARDGDSATNKEISYRFVDIRPNAGGYD